MRIAFTISTLLLCSSLLNAQDIERKTTKSGNILLSVTNVGTLGKPDFRTQPNDGASMRFPKNNFGIEHLFEAGIWLGADVNGDTLVSTSSVTSSSGYSKGGSGFEFTPITNIEQKYSDEGAISDFDLTTRFSDSKTEIDGITISGHDTPLNANVQLKAYSWGEKDHDNFVILEYTVTNSSLEAWKDFYFGLYSKLNVRSLTSNDVGSDYYNKGGYGYIDSLYTVYSFDAGSNDSGSNTYGAITLLGSKLGGNFVHPINKDYLEHEGIQVPEVKTSFWTYSAGSGVLKNPISDTDKYLRMDSEFPIEEYREKLRTDGQTAGGNYESLISIGPYNEVLPNDSLKIYVGVSGALKPENFQDLSGKKVDNEETRTFLKESIERQFNVVTGEDINDFTDELIIPNYSGLSFAVNNLPPSTFEAIDFKWNFSGPETDLLDSYEFALNDSINRFPITIINENSLLIYNRNVEGNKKATVITDGDYLTLEEVLLEGDNTIYLYALNQEGEILDSFRYQWKVNHPKHDILLIHDYEDTPSSFATTSIFSDFEYDSLSFEDGNYLYLETRSGEISKSLKEAMKGWKGIIWVDNYSSDDNINMTKELFSSYLESGGKVFFYTPKFNGSLDEGVKNMIGIETIKSTNIQKQFFIPSGSIIEPSKSDYNLDTLEYDNYSYEYMNLFRPFAYIDSLYEVNFSARMLTGGSEELGKYPVIWHNVESGVAFAYIDLHSDFDILQSKNIIKTIINDVLDIPSTVLISNENIVKDNTLPKEVSLSQNYPNPFNPSTNIRYNLPKTSSVSLKVYDILGREVSTIVNSRQQQGDYIVNFNSSSLSSGVYFYQIKAGDFVQTRRMMLIK